MAAWRADPGGSMGLLSILEARGVIGAGWGLRGEEATVELAAVRLRLRAVREGA